MKKILLSVKPRFVDKILSGEKKYEFRKRVPLDTSNCHVLIYKTHPDKIVVAEFVIGEIMCATPQEIWLRTYKEAGLSFDEFKKYYDGKIIAYAYKITDLHEFTIPRNLAEYGLKRAPQDFCYVEDSE